MSQAIDKKALVDWDKYVQELLRATTVNLNETETEKRKRIKDLEDDPEKWFDYYFPHYCTAKLSRFHRRALKRLIANKRWFEVLMWSRELAKSTFTMMTVVYLVLAKKELKNILLVSNSYDNAERLLTPYRLNLQNNQRIINDYGIQEKPGNWESGEFVTREGTSFRALGAGQSPRGTRNENFRVDCILVDDIDTDEECRNEKRVKDKFKWIQEALIPTVSVSGNYRIIFCGNKIAKVCTVELATKLADNVSLVNIRDENGKSSWPEKNSEADIDKILSLLSYSSAQKEYFNNPISEGTVFKEMQYKKLQPLQQYKFLVCYTDPSFKESKKNDFKATVLLGRFKDEYHVVKAFCDQTSTANMIDWHYQIDELVNDKTSVYYFMEANFIQDTLLKEFYKEAETRHKTIPLKGDPRKKPDKFTRIESALEPLNRLGKLWLNIDEKDNKHMVRLEEQFLALEPGSSAHDDAPDAVEGAKYIIDSKTINDTSKVDVNKFKSRNNKRR